MNDVSVGVVNRRLDRKSRFSSRRPQVKSGFKRLAFGAAAALALVAVQTPDAHAQYFGRNKVQYGSFNFSVLKTEHFDILYYDKEKAAAEIAGRMAERWYARLSHLLDHQLSNRQVVIMYASH